MGYFTLSKTALDKPLTLILWIKSNEFTLFKTLLSMLDYAHPSSRIFGMTWQKLRLSLFTKRKLFDDICETAASNRGKTCNYF